MVARSEASSFDASNPDYSKCLNPDLCRLTGNNLKAIDYQLVASTGGYGVIVANRGSAGVNAHVFLTVSSSF